jgi:polysaccharide pyruvyl transferase WcaK-like protein
MKNKSTRKIGLMGFFGYGNLGDEGLQETMIQQIHLHIPNVEIYGFSLVPEDTEKRHGIKSFHISRPAGEQNNAKPSLSTSLAGWLAKQNNGLLRKLERWVVRIPIELSLLRDAYRNLKGFDALLIAGSGPLTDYWGGAVQ